MSVLVDSARDVSQDESVTVEEPSTPKSIAGQVAVTVAIGLLLIAYAGYRARTTTGSVDMFYWPGVLMLYLGPAWAALAPNVRRSDRIAAVVLGGVATTVSRILLYPTHFAYHDELLHMNSLRLIQENGHLFEAMNSMLPVSKYYPGLEVATDGIHRITGLSTHVAGSALLVAGRIVLMLSLIRSVEWITKSARTACIAGALYICSQQFTFFNSQFSYQSVALPLCFYAVYLFGTRNRATNWSLLAPSLALGAAAMSHHLTALGGVMVFVGWWLMAKIRKTPQQQAGLMALIALGILAAWTAFAHDQVLRYVKEIFQSSAESISHVVGGDQESNELFADNGGEKTPLWQRGASVLAVLVTVAGLAVSLLRARKDRKSKSSAAIALLFVAALYPLIPASHLTVTSAEVGDRSSSFIYVGVAFAIAGWLALLPVTRIVRSGAFAMLTIMYVGGVILGGGPPWLKVPGPYLVAGDNRGVDANGMAAAYWMHTYMTPDNRIMVDRVNGLLDATYGRQHVFRHLGDKLDMGTTSTLLLNGPQGDYDKELVRYADLDYLVADRRLAAGLPRFGVYIEAGEAGTRGTEVRRDPPPLEAFTKFDYIEPTERIYDNGAIAVYDVRSLK
jgi:hypothetical protein